MALDFFMVGAFPIMITCQTIELGDAKIDKIKFLFMGSF